MKKRLLFVDEKVPCFDTAAGARSSFKYLQLLVAMGLDITFVGVDFIAVEPYTSALKELGIKVLDGRWYRRFCKLWLRLNACQFDYVFFNRPGPTQLFIDIAKRFSQAKILYQCHDLHYLRWQRSYECDNDEKSLLKSKSFKEIEMEIFRKADLLLTFSEFEQDVICREFPGTPVEVLPLFFYDHHLPPVTDFSQRKTLLFVGGFNHTPNVDAILWFCREIFPRILETNPGIVLTVAGSSPPPEVIALRTSNILVLGRVEDDQLDELYRSARVVVVPLRFGAGVKGKVVEAIHQSVPVVSTGIGLEGIPGIRGIVDAADTVDDFSRRVTELYTSLPRLTKISDNFSEFSSRYLTSDHAAKKIQNCFSLLSK